MLKKLTTVPTIVAGDMTQLKELLNPKNDGIDLPYSLAFASLAPGTSSLPHRLSGTEVYHIIKGKGRAVLEGESYSIEKGDTLLVPPNIIQFLVNAGQQPLDFICIVSPPWSEDGEEIIEPSIQN